MGTSGHSVVPTVSLSRSGKGEWKGVELDADVSLSISFGCRYVQFSLPVTSSSEPVAKCPSAFDVLFVNTVRHDELTEKPKLFLPQNFILTNRPNSFRQANGNTKYIWSGLTDRDSIRLCTNLLVWVRVTVSKDYFLVLLWSRPVKKVWQVKTWTSNHNICTPFAKSC